MFTESVKALFRMRGELPPGSGLSMATTGASSSIAFNRNVLTEQFLADPSFKYILFLDSDMVPERDTVTRLLNRNVDVVSALYFQRGKPFCAVYEDRSSNPGLAAMCDCEECRADSQEAQRWEDNGLRPVISTGAGCLLVKRQVIEELKGKYPFPWEHPVPGGKEDTLFCNRIHEIGYKVFVDTACVVGHVGAVTVDREVVELYQRPKHPIGPLALGTQPKRFDTNGVYIPQPPPRSLVIQPTLTRVPNV
jgi:hypothetical protein